MGQSNESKKNSATDQVPANNNLCSICKRQLIVMNVSKPSQSHNFLFICKPCLYTLYLQIMNQTQHIPSIPINCNSCKVQTYIYFPGQEFYQQFIQTSRSVSQTQRPSNFMPPTTNNNNNNNYYFSQNLPNPLQAQFMNYPLQKTPPRSAFPAFRNPEGVTLDENKNKYILDDKYKSQLDNIIKEMVRNEENEHEEFLKSYSGRIEKNGDKNKSIDLDPSLLKVEIPLLGKKKIECKCLIDYDMHKPNDMKLLNCNHFFCQPCLKEYLHNLLKENKVSENDLCCPNCATPINDNIIEQILDQEDWTKLTKFRMKKIAAQQDKNSATMFVFCPKCDAIFEVDKYLKTINCIQCRTTFCKFCSNNHDSNVTCESYEKWKEENDQAENKFDSYVNLKKKNREYAKCPKCKAWIEKNQGCNHMTCRSPVCQAKTEFCFVCSTQYINKIKQCAC